MKRIFVLLLFSLLVGELFAADKVVKIGILALRGKDITYAKWDATAKYLDDKVSGYDFKIIPLNFSEIDSTIASKKVDFILANSSIYVDMEYRHKIGRIATLKRKTSSLEAVSIFGGVIFTKSNRSDIKSLKDLKDKHLAAVDPTSFGGWHMAWFKMKQNNFDPKKELSNLTFSGTHDKVVYDVLKGRADAGTVRTGVLESMAREQKINLSDIKVLSKQKCNGLKILNSTSCYPEWPFAKLSDTPDNLVDKVAIALIEMNSSDLAAKTADIYGWTIPYNYQSVHELRKELKLSPYDKEPEITLTNVFRKYWHIILFTFFITLIFIVATIRIFGLNMKLRKSEMLVKKNYEQLKHMQSQLVESEKMASLGGLVAGVSHEINTPVGLASTSISHLLDEVKELKFKYESQEMSENDFTEFLSLFEELGNSIDLNLTRAANLVRSFKQVAVDQSSEALREFNVKEYVQEVLSSLYNKTKKTKHHINLDIEPNLKIENYPGAFSQIITNLIMNSLIHGYNQDDEGDITIKFERIRTNLIFTYRDDGKGISQDNLKKIFDPFFTTNRKNGGSGLGMNIVYNIVKQKLKGNIICKSELGKGVEFKITMPCLKKEKISD